MMIMLKLLFAGLQMVLGVVCLMQAAPDGRVWDVVRETPGVLFMMMAVMFLTLASNDIADMIVRRSTKAEELPAEK